MTLLKTSFTTFARFLFSLYFIVGAIKNLFSWKETENGLLSALSEWQSHFVNMHQMQACFTFFMSWSAILLVLATLFCLVGGVFILIGIKERIGMTLLILVLLVSTFLYYPFWWAESAFQEMQIGNFLKNISILGALFLLVLPQSKENEYSRNVESYSPPGDDYSSMGY